MKEFCRIEDLAITRKINSLALESLTVVNCTGKGTLNYVHSPFSDLKLHPCRESDMPHYK